MVGKKQGGAKKSPAQVRADLDIFEKGIIRLKELDGELKALDTQGFYEEEQSIRAKLKNVSDIPLIEREIKSLRLKIDNKHKPKRVKRSSYGKMGKEIREIREELPEIKGGIKRLSKKIEETKRGGGKVDSGVGVLVDTDFNDFLSDIKVRLSGRVKAREKKIDNTLRKDLQKREKRFAKKYATLVRQFGREKAKLEKDKDEQYKMRVQTSLQKEVSEKFNEKLRRKLGFEKAKLVEQYKQLLRLHVKEEVEERKEKLRKRLENKFAEKLGFLESQFAGKLGDLEKEELENERKREILGAKKKSLETEKGKIEQGNRKRQKALETEKGKLGEKDKKRQKILEAEKNKLEYETREKQKILEIKRSGLEQDKERFAIRKEEERERIKHELMDKFHGEVEKELVKKEKIIRGQLRNEFELNLKKKIQEHESDLKRRKFSLELEIQRRMREALK